MFLESMKNGLILFFSFDVIVACIAYGVISLGFVLLAGIIFSRKSTMSKIAGGTIYLFGGTFLQSFLTTILVWYLFPLMLNGDKPFPFSEIFSNVGLLAKSWAISGIVVFLIGTTPVLGHMIESIPGSVTFIQGAILFRLICSGTIDPVIKKQFPQADIYPGFFASVGYCISAFIMLLVVVFCFTVLPKILLREKNFGLTDRQEFLSMIISPTAVKVSGFLPVFMYAQYAVLSISKLH